MRREADHRGLAQKCLAAAEACGGYRAFFDGCCELKLLPNCKGYWIPRELNARADDLSKAELRRLGVEFRIQPEEDAA